jgi:outer membrane protein TolC
MRDSVGCRYAVPQVTQPIFTAGRLKSNVRLAEAERELALIAHQRVRESRMKQEALVIVLQDRLRPAQCAIAEKSSRSSTRSTRIGICSWPNSIWRKSG